MVPTWFRTAGRFYPLNKREVVGIQPGVSKAGDGDAVRRDACNRDDSVAAVICELQVAEVLSIAVSI